MTHSNSYSKIKQVREARDDFDALLMWLQCEWQRYQGSELENSGERDSEMLKRRKKNRIRLDPRCRDILIRMLRKTTSLEGDKKMDMNYLLHDDVSAHLEDAREVLPSHYTTRKGTETKMSDCEIGILQDVEELFETSFGSRFSTVTFGHVRGVRARSARISINSVFHVSTTGLKLEEHHSHRSLIPQKKILENVNARIQTRL